MITDWDETKKNLEGIGKWWEKLNRITVAEVCDATRPIRELEAGAKKIPPTWAGSLI